MSAGLLTTDLFASVPDLHPSQELMAEGAVLLRGFAVPLSAALGADLQIVIARAPFRHMATPGGLSMSVAMTNCGAYGWVSERSGYRYDPIDPESGKPWPSMSESFARIGRMLLLVFSLTCKNVPAA